MKRRPLIVRVRQPAFDFARNLAQKATRRPRIGYLAPSWHPYYEDVFRQELRRLGYIHGETIAAEYCSADGDFDIDFPRL